MILRIQHGVCAICHRPPSPTRCLDIDHNHKTGAIRGLLCHLCNRGLAFFREAMDLLRANDYLQRTPTGFYMPKKKRRR